MMTNSEIETMNLLSSAKTMLNKFKAELAIPGCYERFQQNIHVLRGIHNMSLTSLAQKTGRDIGDLSKLVSGKSQRRFERLKPEDIEQVAEVLGVNLRTILFVDLKKSFLEIIEQEEEI